jgi:RNA 3'-terminal phosphate cyclase (ATP)
MALVGTPIQLEGAHGEGGGALLRTALVLSALTQQALRITSIRGATKFPGLSAEDLMLIRALRSICQAETVQAELGSQELSFLPTRRPRAFKDSIPWFEIANDRSFVCAQVVLGALLPVLAQAGAMSHVSCDGETFGQGILTYDYFEQVTLAAHRKLGLYAYPSLNQAGFGRFSRGQVSLEVEPSALSGIDWPTRGEFLSASAKISWSGLSSNIVERGAAHLKRLGHSANLELAIETAEVESETPGIFITAWADFSRGVGGATGMGQRGVRIEQVAQSAFDGLFQWVRSEATVDAWLADQILVTAAIAEGDSQFIVPRLTQRLLTIAWVIKQFLPIRLTIKGGEGEPGTISIRRGGS